MFQQHNCYPAFTKGNGTSKSLNRCVSQDSYELNHAKRAIWRLGSFFLGYYFCPHPICAGVSLLFHHPVCTLQNHCSITRGGCFLTWLKMLQFGFNKLHQKAEKKETDVYSSCFFFFFSLSTVQEVVTSIQVIRKRIKGDLVLVTGKARGEMNYMTFQMSFLQIILQKWKKPKSIKLYFCLHWKQNS